VTTVYPGPTTRQTSVPQIFKTRAGLTLPPWKLCLKMRNLPVSDYT
ncbi:hypothetical protein M8J77_004920, partial [Diaphorina citri]